MPLGQMQAFYVGCAEGFERVGVWAGRARRSVRGLKTKLGVRPHTNQIKMLIVRFTANQDRVGLDMAVPMIGPFAGKLMVNISRAQGHISREQMRRPEQAFGRTRNGLLWTKKGVVDLGSK